MTYKILLITSLLILLSACTDNNEMIQPTSTSVPSPTLTSTFTPIVTTFPTSELSPYYGEPEPIQIIFDNKTYDSQIGTTSWIIEAKPDGTTTRMIGDAFAIITPVEPIVTKSDFSFILKLPIPINPTELWYIVYKTSEDELSSQDSSHGALAWNPDYKTQMYIENMSPLLSIEQNLNFSLESGIYIFEVHIGWGGIPPHTELEADYGFLLKVQE